MPSCGGLFRIIRRRLVLGLIFALSLTYCAFSLFRNEKKTLALDTDLDDMDAMMINDNNDDLISDDDALSEQLRASGKPPLWQVDQGTNDNALNMEAIPNLNDTDTVVRPCRNSVQGKALIVDERGIVCARQDILPNGCCNIEQKDPTKNEEPPSIYKRERYSCKTCNVQGCCAIYEYCVSCCLHPGKQMKGRKDVLIGLLRDNNKVHKDQDVVKKRLRNLDRFQVCLAACRTSSASVRHENTYKDPHSKHCYTLQPPYSHQRHRRDVNTFNNNGDNPVVVTSFSVMPLLTLLSPFCVNIHPNNDSQPSSCNYHAVMSLNYYSHVQPP
ncbi:SREBP regulating gene protein [Colletes gigas]|uniref:SREBP regulating gene protein n=1 Tax=Colletes gigas TaxID=935657 RepID=UPI001C9A4E5C|nr:SREBP regulating gene protein [Colletes gigas]XP_043254174.1 SREBP regulating gene protein [Colletes gigas]